jgi:hypothetical protein
MCPRTNTVKRLRDIVEAFGVLLVQGTPEPSKEQHFDKTIRLFSEIGTHVVVGMSGAEQLRCALNLTQ